MSEESTCPKISIVMSVYNGEGVLAETLDGILGQTTADWEFVIVNDGSSDGSQQLLEEYAARDSRFVLIDQENGGLTAALQVACKRARGKFIARQDVGDISLPRRLELQSKYLEENSKVVVVCPFVQLLGPGRELLEVLTFPEDPLEATRQWWEERRAPVHSATMFRRDAYELAGGYRSAFRTAQDHDLWYRLLLLGQLGFVPVPLFQWILDETGISAQGGQLQARFAEIAHRCHLARTNGQAESQLLSEAIAVMTKFSAGTSGRKAGEVTSYFVANRLLARQDPRCTQYFYRTLMVNCWNLKARFKYWACLLRFGSSEAFGEKAPISQADIGSK